MKPLIVLLLTAFIACSPKPQSASTTCLKGKLVKRGICGQRVIELIGEPVEALAMATQWTDSLSGKNYNNVFTVGNLCDFPASIQEGEEFNFTITTTPASNCATCFAYTPTPKEKNNIAAGCAQ